jgi:N-acetylglucosamine-6-sulfatase
LISSTRRRSVAGTIAVSLAATALGLTTGGEGNAAVRSAAASPPNFLFILVDDQATNSFHRRFMPATFKRIVDRGTMFTNALAAPPLCCPDRAGLLTGQYPHNNHVWSNHPGYAELTDRENTLGTWLQRAGYRTGYFGKFLNHYGSVSGLAGAPGFDRWFAFTDEGTSYYDYEIADDGTRVSYGHDRADYSTDVLSRQAAAFMSDNVRASRPFFAWLAYSAPHLNRTTSGPCAGSNPIPPDEATLRRFEDEPLPQPPSFDERGIGDKPYRIAQLPRISSDQTEQMTLRWRCTLAAMSVVDADVDTLMSGLQSESALDDTIVIYLSDNGFFFGEHRIPNGKGLVYEPALRVPFAIRVPRKFRTGPLDPRTNAVVANQDVAPTILRYVNRFGGSASPCIPSTGCRRLDGRSLLPLLQGGGRWRSGGRGVLVEIDSRRNVTTATAAKRRIDPECGCAYEAIRTHRYVYSEPSVGGRELYDLERDPDELSNKIRSRGSAPIRRELAARLALLERCSGQPDRDPPRSRPYCE